MQIEAKITGMDELKGLIHSNIREALIEAGEEAIKVQKVESDYLNHTFNLRNAPGYAVTIKGKEVARKVPADSSHVDAKKKTEKTLDQADKTGTGAYLC